MNTAKIIAVTQPFIDNENGVRMTPDEFIAYCARVSNPSNQMNSLTAPKLLRYCAKHKHWSVFETVSITMSIETTRDIARQILRHRSFSFQEFSQRYADPTQDLGFVTREARLQDMKNRQNSIETNDKELETSWNEMQTYVRASAENAYIWAVENGIAKEQARSVLPEGLTVSRMYMNGTLRSYIHWCQIRTGPETQKEHREIALDAWYQITEQFPSLKDCLDLGEK
jgi:thymidylate synthase (FAD)